MAKNTPRRVELLVAILERDLETAYAAVCNDCAVGVHFSAPGYGTAPKEYRHFFGLDEIEKRVAFSLVPNTSVKQILSRLTSELKLYLPGRGLAFTVPLSGISSIVSDAVLSTPEKVAEKNRSRKKEKTAMHEIVIAVVYQKFTDIAIDAARAAGATGCTILHTKSLDNRVSEARIGTALQPETDMLSFLTTSETKPAIMAAIRDAAGLKTEGSAVIFSLPVNDIVGIGRFADAAEDENDD